MRAAMSDGKSPNWLTGFRNSPGGEGGRGAMINDHDLWRVISILRNDTMDPGEQEREIAELTRIIEPMLRDFVRCPPGRNKFPRSRSYHCGMDSQCC
jgi:hypothetical protein